MLNLQIVPFLYLCFINFSPHSWFFILCLTHSILHLISTCMHSSNTRKQSMLVSDASHSPEVLVLEYFCVSCKVSHYIDVDESQCMNADTIPHARAVVYGMMLCNEFPNLTIKCLWWSDDFIAYSPAWFTYAHGGHRTKTFAGDNWRRLIYIYIKKNLYSHILIAFFPTVNQNKIFMFNWLLSLCWSGLRINVLNIHSVDFSMNYVNRGKPFF